MRFLARDKGRVTLTSGGVSQPGGLDASHHAPSYFGAFIFGPTHERAGQGEKVIIMWPLHALLTQININASRANTAAARAR